jgi:hypothetical protein
MNVISYYFRSYRNIIEHDLFQREVYRETIVIIATIE